MKTIQSGEIGVFRINGKWTSNVLKAERTRGDSSITLLVPIGPRSKEKILINVDEDELTKLVLWMKGEIR